MHQMCRIMVSRSRWHRAVVWSLFVLIVVSFGGKVASAADEQILLSIRDELYTNVENRAILEEKYRTDNGTTPCNWTGITCRSPDQTVVSVFMTNVSLQGPLPTGFGALLNLTRLSLQGNRFSGPIPEGIFNSSSNLELVDFSSNRLTDSIPTSVGGLKKLSILSMANNSLTGTLTPLAGLKSFGTINSIYLQNNEIGGDLSALEGMTSLVVLELGSNKLIGNLDALGALRKLQKLDLNNNQLSSTFNSMVDLQATQLTEQSQSQLLYLDLSSNQLFGSISDGLFSSTSRLYSLDLSDNNLSGSMSPAAVVSLLETLELNRNQLSGSIPIGVLNIMSLKILDMSQNSFSGNLTGFINRTGLTNLDLSFNMLTGEVPETIFLVPQADVVNLSHNNFSGPLPAASNDLVNQDSFLLGDNPDLCSPTGNFSLTRCAFSPGPASTPEISQGKEPDSNGSKSGKEPQTAAILIGVVGAIVVLVGVLVGLCLYCKYKNRSSQLPDNADQQHSSFPLIAAIQDGGKSIRVRTMKELEDATNNFSPSNQIGSGGFGTVYRGILDGQEVAIKKSEMFRSEEAKRQIMNEISVLSQVHHRNLVSLLGCCLTSNAAILVLEYVPRGTLEHHLYGAGEERLSWSQRLKIALQTAEALNYLHTAAYPPILHQDVKSANILLDSNYDAKVADFGISKLVPKDVTHITALRVEGTRAYIDPDLHVSHHVTPKSDVYSFGVVLLEILTGRPAREFGIRGHGLARWAALLADPASTDVILDPLLLEERGLNIYEDFTTTAVEMAQLAFRCLQLLPADRPSMKVVASTLSVLIGATVSTETSGSSASSRDRLLPAGRSELTDDYLQAKRTCSKTYSGERYVTTSTSTSAALSSSRSRKLDSDSQQDSTFLTGSSEETVKYPSQQHPEVSVELQQVTPEIQLPHEQEQNEATMSVRPTRKTSRSVS